MALLIVDREQRSALDTRLRSVADALRIIGDVKHGSYSLDASDRRQFVIVLGAKAHGAIVVASGAVAVSTDDSTAHVLAARFGAVAGPIVSDVAIDGRSIRVFAEPLIEAGRRVGSAFVWSDLEPVATLDRQVALAFFIVTPLIAAIAMLAASEIARRGLAPLERVATLASEIEAHDLSQRLGSISRDREVSRLAATIDRMLDRLKDAFERERRFTGDASHELRAPLSVIRAEADLALRTPRSTADYMRALETIASEADALEGLTRDLLAAARGGEGGADALTPVDLREIAKTVAVRFCAISGDRRLALSPLGASPAVVAGNRPLLERAVVGVLHNALKYTPDRGTIVIDVGTCDGRAALTITDEGPGFSQTALERAFDRLWRDDDVRGTDGSGLGLSISKTIVERFDGKITLENAVPHGAVVRIEFPSIDACK